MRSKRTRSRPAIVAAGALAPEQPDHVLLREVVEFYHRAIKKHAEPIAFLDKLALRDAEVIDHFKLGFSNRTLGSALPSSDRTLGKTIRKQLVRIGIYSPTGHERYTGSLVVPVFADDEVVELYGHRIRNDVKPTTPVEIWLPLRADGRRGVFNRAAFEASKDVIIAGGLIDALSFWCSGSRHVTATYDLGGLHPELRAGLSKYGSTRLLLAYPRTDEGDQAAEAIAAELGTSGVEVFRIVLPLGMTASQYLRSEGPDALQTVVRAASWLRGTRPVAVPEVVESMNGAQSASTSATTTAAPSALDIDAEVRDQEVVVNFGDRRWRIRGLARNTSYDSLRLNLLVSRRDAFHVDTLELYAARQRASFLKDAAAELGVEERVLKSDLGRIVLRLEELVHEQIEKALELPKPFEMSEADRAEALALLKDRNLVDRVLGDFKRAGVVGEETNLLVGFIAAVSRKLDAPLAVVLQSSSAAGKSSLMEAVLRFVPPEDRIQYSAMTGQSLFYMGAADLKHKVLAIAEEEGVTASYPLKLLQSEGELTIASTGKEVSSGRLVTQTYRVEGPVAIFLTTTAIEVDEELLNRCVVLTVDEGSNQTAAIHERQREARTLEGLFARKDREAVVALQQNAQRLLEPLAVVNPLAKSLRFSSRSTRSRRDHTKYLALIDAIALLHQHQREVKEVVHGGERLRYVEVTEVDVALADRLAAEVIGSRVEELPPQTARLLEAIERFVAERSEAQGIDATDVHFTRRQLLEYTHLGHTQLRLHLARLVEFEYLVVHAGGGKRRAVYGLAPELGSARDVQHPNLAGSEGVLAGVWRPHGGPPPRQEEPSHSAEEDDPGGLSPKALIPADENSARCALHVEDDK